MEDKKKFIEDCVSRMVKDGKEVDQAVAICYSMYNDKSEQDYSYLVIDDTFSIDQIDYEDDFTGMGEVEDTKNRKLNKPFRTPDGPKKFSVYVKNDKGNIVKVNFGDPNMEIKRDDPERRKSYRARHNCDNPGPKWKANYWSCKMWSETPVNTLVATAAPMSTREINNLPDSDFAYIEPGGEKDDSGKTVPRSLRHFPIHDAAHVRNALARLPQSNLTKEQKREAFNKIKMRAKRFGIEVSKAASPGLWEDLRRKYDYNFIDTYDENTFALQYGKPPSNDPRKTPAPKKDQKRGSDKNEPDSAKDDKGNISFDESVTNKLEKMVTEHNAKEKGSKVTLGMLKAVYRRGAGAYSTTHHPKMSRDGWAMARVRAFLYLARNGRPSNPNYKQDNDLLPKSHPRSSKAEDDMNTEMPEHEMDMEGPEHELMEYKEDFFEMIVGSLNAINMYSETILNNLENESVRENLTEPFLQGTAALAEDYLKTIHNYVMFNYNDSGDS